MKTDKTVKQTTKEKQYKMSEKAETLIDNELKQKIDTLCKKLNLEKTETADAVKAGIDILAALLVNAHEKMIVQELKPMNQEIKNISEMIEQHAEKLASGSAPKANKRKDEFAQKFFTRVSNLPMAKRTISR